MAKRKPTTKKGTFILWAKNSPYPPRKTWDTQDEAERIARICSVKYNDDVYVMRAVALATPERPVTTPPTLVRMK